MNQALNAGLYFNKRPEVGDARHRAVYASPRPSVSPATPSQGWGSSCFMPTRNALFLGINLEHLGFDLLPHREHVLGIAHAAPGDIADVQQRVHAAYIDKRAIVGKAAHLATAPSRLL